MSIQYHDDVIQNVQFHDDLIKAHAMKSTTFIRPTYNNAIVLAVTDKCTYTYSRHSISQTKIITVFKHTINRSYKVRIILFHVTQSQSFNTNMISENITIKILVEYLGQTYENISISKVVMIMCYV